MDNSDAGNGGMMEETKAEGPQEANQDEFLKEILKVEDWINKGCLGTINRQSTSDGTPSPLIVKVEERFKRADGRISDLEGRLKESQNENRILKAKLNAMELLAGHQQCEIIRLTKELENQKWERLNAEAGLKKMVKDVAEMQATIGGMVRTLQREENFLETATTKVKKEPRHLGSESLENKQFSGDGAVKSEPVDNVFRKLADRMNDRLQKYEQMQTDTKAELAGIMKGISQLERTMRVGNLGKTRPSAPTPSSAILLSESTSVVARKKTMNPKPHGVTSAPAILPVPIKSILMKRSADGTFVIRRDDAPASASPRQYPPHSSVKINKRKRVQFRLDDSKPYAQTDRKENQRSSNSSLRLLPDPLEPDNGATPHDRHDDSREHFETKVQGDNRKFCNCGRSFLHRKLLDRHLSVKLYGKIFTCQLCSKGFVLHESLKKHVQKLHKIQYHGGRYGCRDCGQTFALYGQLLQHRTIHEHRTKISSSFDRLRQAMGDH